MKDAIKFNDATLTFKFMSEHKMFMTVLRVKNVDELTFDAFISPFGEGEKVFETFTSRIVEYTELAEELRRYARNEPDADKKCNYRREAERAYDAAQLYRQARGLFFHAQARVFNNYWGLTSDWEIVEEFQRLINEEAL